MESQITEKQLESQILDWLNYQHGIFAFKVNTTGIYDPTKEIFRTVKNRHIHRGTSDILGVKNGKFFAIEVKTPTSFRASTKRPKKHDLDQLNFINRIKVAHGSATRVSSLDEVMSFINSIDTV